MANFQEDFLHYIWKYKLYHPDYLSYRNSTVEIIDPGIHNFSSGPDFFNARVRIGDTIWAGNVEIHLNASDWYKHNHQNDPAYDNVILHVVYNHDKEIYRADHEEIPWLRLSFSSQLLKKYNNLTHTAHSQKDCIQYLPSLEKVFLRDWIGKLMIERLKEKTAYVFNLLTENKFNWEETLYKLLARSFGMKLNADTFYILATKVPLRFVMKYRNSPDVLNAVFYGQAGFLDEFISDESRYNFLRREYLAVKSMLPPPMPGRYVWKYMRARPAGYPPLRIAQLMAIISRSFPLFENLLLFSSLKEMKNFLRFSLKNYGEKFFLYGNPNKGNYPVPGNKVLESIIMNAFLPLLFIYGKERGKEEICERVICFLEELPAENNIIIEKWSKFGLKASNIFESQALIQLETKYCEKQRCLDCLLGHKILTEI
jgi:Protein of unknown function (DUF2851)